MPSGFEEEDFFKCVTDIFSKIVIFPFERDGALHLNKLESPSPNDILGEVWVKWPTGSEEDDFSNSLMDFLLFLNYLNVETNGVLYLKKKVEYPSLRDDLCHV